MLGSKPWRLERGLPPRKQTRTWPQRPGLPSCRGPLAKRQGQNPAVASFPGWLTVTPSREVLFLVQLGLRNSVGAGFVFIVILQEENIQGGSEELRQQS